jgi:hypothetical protein
MAEMAVQVAVTQVPAPVILGAMVVSPAGEGAAVRLASWALLRAVAVPVVRALSL